MTDALLVGLSGLQAHQRAIEVTSHNIANATTPGYTRQRADLIAHTPENIAIGQLGRGVTVEGINRLANDLIIERQRQATSEDGRLSRLTETVKTAESIFNEPGDNGLSAGINRLFASFEDLSNNPESTALRATAVAQMGTFTDTLNNLGNRLQQLRDDIRTTLEGEVAELNELNSAIVKLNQQIREQVLVGKSPNDLLDRRDQMVSELSGKLGLRVRTMPSDGSVMIDSGGILLIGRDYAEQLSVGVNADGTLALLLSNKTGIPASGGSVGALMDLHSTILPGLIDDVDTLTSGLVMELNARQSTGINHSFVATSFTSEFSIDASLAATNLDDPSQVQGENGGPGMPQVFLPSFTDANGNLVARNLDINVYDPTTGVANKYVLRYDPTTGGGTRSLDDLVSTINSGRSTLAGGFTLYPPQAGGITGLSARKVPIDGGFRLELSASGGKTIDFSRALDVQPTVGAWTSGATTVTGSDPGLAGKRVVFTVVGGALRATTRDAVSGVESVYGTPLALGGAAGVIGGLSLTLTPGAGNYTNGDSFAVDFTSVGAVDGVTATQNTAWTQGDAAMTVRGRYAGEVTFAPGREWSMRVITGGTIGATSGAPLVEFTFLTGSADAPVQQKIQKVLDDFTPSGTPIPIADGVYAVFAAGTLSTAGNQLSFIVDAETDQARLLPALGINTMFSGATAATVQVSAALRADANRLAVGTSRAEGDNSNLAGLEAVRRAKIFSGGSVGVDDFYHTTVTGLGVRVSDSKRLQDSQQLLRTSLENQRQEVSGVSIDEEVAFLILQQQAYTASARVITTARENITTLLELVR